MKTRFMQRIHEEERPRRGSTLYTDICHAQEQLIDYCDMIGDALIRYGKNLGDITQNEPGADELTRSQIHEIFADKYEALEKYYPVNK